MSGGVSNHPNTKSGSSGINALSLRWPAKYTNILSPIIKKISACGSESTTHHSTRTHCITALQRKLQSWGRTHWNLPWNYRKHQNFALSKVQIHTIQAGSSPAPPPHPATGPSTTHHSHSSSPNCYLAFPIKTLHPLSYTGCPLRELETCTSRYCCDHHKAVTQH